MLSTEITYEFEELPLVVDGGMEAGLVNGTASISVHPDGEWTVTELALDGFRRATGADNAKPGSYIHVSVPLCREVNSWLYSAIVDQLENGTHKSHVEGRVEAVLDDLRVPLAPNAEHSTLNHAQQGI